MSYYVIHIHSTADRQKLIDKIYETLNWGGAFVWFEKVRAQTHGFRMAVNMYHNFKLDNGYDAEEIMNKQQLKRRWSLSQVMEILAYLNVLGLKM